jgi:hypothetical protein
MKGIIDVFERARRQIGREVGYVPQQIACGWARANAQDIQRSIETPQLFDSIRQPLAELLLNTCCVADQYHVNLRKAYRDGKLSLVLDTAIASSTDGIGPHAWGEELVERTERLTSTLAFYHGWNWSSSHLPLRKQIPGLHKAIYALSNLMQVDLVGGVSQTIEDARNNLRSDKNTDRYDPVTSLVLRDFAPIKENSVCTFAPEAKMWGARPWDSKKSFEANLNDSLETLACLSRCGESEEVDAFLVALPAYFGTSVPRLAATVDRVLQFFAQNDPSGNNCFDKIKQKMWRYQFLKVPYFVQAFGPCYGSDNTRFAENVKATFINFVTEFSFHRLISKEKYHEVRHEIRERARSQGRPYDIHPHETDFFVHTKSAGLPPVKWVGTSKRK